MRTSGTATVMERRGEALVGCYILPFTKYFVHLTGSLFIIGHFKYMDVNLLITGINEQTEAA